MMGVIRMKDMIGSWVMDDGRNWTTGIHGG